MGCAPIARLARASACALALQALPAAARAGDATTPPAVRWRVELAVAGTSRRDLAERGHDTPAPETETEVAAPWEASWRERSAWLSLTREVAAGRRGSLEAGLRAGAALGRFAAANAELPFFESWDTAPAPAWGAVAAGELRGDPGRGPFLRARAGYGRAAAAEDVETIRPASPATPEGDRDARFSWHRTDADLCAGWRRGRLAVLAGAAYSRFVLLKRLRYHIPVPEDPGAAPFAFEIARKLNARESAYRYRNRRPWSPLVGLEWRPGGAWAVSAECALNAGTDCRAAVGLRF